MLRDEPGDLGAAVNGMTIATRKIGLSRPLISHLRKSMNTSALTLPWVPMKRSYPFGLMAEIGLSLKRAPVALTIGVCPTGAQVVPL